jgi:predicted aspartyl protease
LPSTKPFLRVKGPYVDVQLKNPRTGTSLSARAIIDTGASTVCITMDMARRLDLIKTGAIPMGVPGNTVMGISFEGEVVIPEMPFSLILRVHAPKGGDPNTPILLGRSLLKFFHLTYDGPADEFTLALASN